MWRLTKEKQHGCLYISGADQVVLHPENEPHTRASRRQELTIFRPIQRKQPEKSAAHNSAVLLCRLRCISRADQIVLHTKNRGQSRVPAAAEPWYTEHSEVGSLVAAKPARENRTPVHPGNRNKHSPA